MPTLPVQITIGGAPPEAVSRFSVTCGYTLQGVHRVACKGELDFHGGMLQGFLDSDPLGAFPATVRVDVNVDVPYGTGLASHSEAFPNINVNSSGVNFLPKLPIPIMRLITILIPTSKLDLGGKVLLTWDHLVSGNVVKSANIPVEIVLNNDPAPQLINLLLDAKTSNELKLNLVGVHGTLHVSAVPADFALVPFSSSIPLNRNQVVILRPTIDKPNKKVTFAAEIS